MGDHLGFRFIGNIQDDHIAAEEIRKVSPASRNNRVVQADPTAFLVSRSLSGRLTGNESGRKDFQVINDQMLAHPVGSPKIAYWLEYQL
jgi:hypothetical protein